MPEELRTVAKEYCAPYATKTADFALLINNFKR